MDYLSPDCRLQSLTMVKRETEPELMDAMIQRLMLLSEQMMLMSLTTTEWLICPFSEKPVTFFFWQLPIATSFVLFHPHINLYICDNEVNEVQAVKLSQSNTTNCINLNHGFFSRDAMEENVILCNYNFSPCCFTVTGDVSVITRFTNVCLIGCD